MAEERLIDDDRDKDKDRKYRIVLGEDGAEDDGYDDYDDYDDYGDEEDYGELLDDEYEDDDDYYDDAENARFDDDVIADNERAGRINNARELLLKAQRLHDAGDDDYAMAALRSAESEYCALEDIYPLMMEILTAGYTNISDPESCCECAEKCRRYCSS